MQHSTFTEQQIAFVLEQVARGVSVGEMCRAAGISAQTFYRWRTKYAGMRPAEIRSLREIEDENRRLKGLLEMLVVANQAPKEAPLLLPAPHPELSSPSPSMSTTKARHWSADADDLPESGSLEEVLVQARVFLKRAYDWTVAHGAELREHATREVRHKVLVPLRKMWRTRRPVVLCFAGGLVGGFAIGLSPTATTRDNPQVVPVNMDVRANSNGARVSTMDEGWGQTQSWGRWMEGDSASILLGVDGPARGDVELLLEARTRLAKGRPDETLVVRFNEQEIGRWRLPKQGGSVRRRFVVPRDVFNRETAAKLTFVLDGEVPPSPVFGLEAASLRDVRFLHDYRGFVDSCSNDEVVGWAVAEGLPVTVAASVGDKPISYTQTSSERPDLPEHGIPEDAGFQLKLAEPVPAGTAIDVRFADGRRLTGAPCRP
jgi:putative transposase